MRKPVIISVLCACLAWSLWPENQTNLTYVASVRVLDAYAHDTSSFTQGLCVDASGRLYESDGLYGKSKVRRVHLTSGTSERERHNGPRHFGEGLTVVPTPDGPVLLQLTWRESVMFEYSLDLQLLREIPQPLPREGWGATYDAKHDLLYLSDGTSKLRAFRRTPGGDYVAEHETTVVDPNLGGLAIDGLNELEMVGDDLWANVFPMHHHSASNCVCRIDPTSGHVRGWLDANVLLKRESTRVRRFRMHYVLNGIAVMPDDRLLLTGKQWEHLYHVGVKSEPSLGPDHVKQACDLYWPPQHHHHHHTKEEDAAPSDL